MAENVRKAYSIRVCAFSELVRHFSHDWSHGFGMTRPLMEIRLKIHEIRRVGGGADSGAPWVGKSAQQDPKQLPSGAPPPTSRGSLLRSHCRINPRDHTAGVSSALRHSLRLFLELLAHSDLDSFIYDSILYNAHEDSDLLQFGRQVSSKSQEIVILVQETTPPRNLHLCLQGEMECLDSWRESLGRMM